MTSEAARAEHKGRREGGRNFGHQPAGRKLAVGFAHADVSQKGPGLGSLGVCPAAPRVFRASVICTCRCRCPTRGAQPRQSDGGRTPKSVREQVGGRGRKSVTCVSNYLGLLFPSWLFSPTITTPPLYSPHVFQVVFSPTLDAGHVFIPPKLSFVKRAKSQGRF